MPAGHGSRAEIFHRRPVKHLVHGADIPVHGDRAVPVHGDSGGFLSAVLQRDETIVSELRNFPLVRTPDAEDTAFLMNFSHSVLLLLRLTGSQDTRPK